MTAFWVWLSKAIKTVYENDGLLGIVILIALAVLIVWWLKLPVAEWLSAWFGG